MLAALQQNISVAGLLAVFILLLFVTILLLVYLVLDGKKMKQVTYPIYDYIIKGAQDEAKKITYEAQKDARKMLVDAELKGMKVIAKEKVESKNIEKEYEEKLDVLMQDTEGLLKKYSESLDKELGRLTDGVEKRIAAGIASNENFLQEETNKLSKQLSSTFTTLEANAKEQIRSNVERELIAVKKVAETYRQERYALVDSEILSLIENTAAIALGKTLSLEEHSELIYKALDEAKSKNTFS